MKARLILIVALVFTLSDSVCAQIKPDADKTPDRTFPVPVLTIPAQSARVASDEQVNFQANTGCPTYLGSLQSTIRRAWFPPKGHENSRVKVRFTILRDGKITSANVIESSGVEAADSAALKAVQSVSSFLPLPKQSPPKVEIEMTFARKVGQGQTIRQNNLPKSN